MDKKRISICLFKVQIVNDVMVLCNTLGRQLQKSADTEELAGEIMTPDDAVTKPVIARSITEAFAEIKRVSQKYLIMGRDTDDNRLEMIDESKKFQEEVHATSAGVSGNYYLQKNVPTRIEVEGTGQIKLQTSDGGEIGTIYGTGYVDYIPQGTLQNVTCITENEQDVKITYKTGNFGKLLLDLEMPATFNPGVTETIKSNAHRMIVDYVMRELLSDQFADKAAVYGKKYEADVEGLRDSLRARLAVCRGAADWS